MDRRWFDLRQCHRDDVEGPLALRRGPAPASGVPHRGRQHAAVRFRRSSAEGPGAVDGAGRVPDSFSTRRRPRGSLRGSGSRGRCDAGSRGRRPGNGAHRPGRPDAHLRWSRAGARADRLPASRAQLCCHSVRPRTHRRHPGRIRPFEDPETRTGGAGVGGRLFARGAPGVARNPDRSTRAPHATPDAPPAVSRPQHRTGGPWKIFPRRWAAL